MKQIFHKIINVVYFCSSVIGAILVASNTKSNEIGYYFYLIASLTCIWMLHQSNAPKSIMYVCMMYAVINVFGIFRA